MGHIKTSKQLSGCASWRLEHFWIDFIFRTIFCKSISWASFSIVLPIFPLDFDHLSSSTSTICCKNLILIFSLFLFIQFKKTGNFSLISLRDDISCKIQNHESVDWWCLVVKQFRHHICLAILISEIFKDDNGQQPAPSSQCLWARILQQALSLFSSVLENPQRFCLVGSDKA